MSSFAQATPLGGAARKSIGSPYLGWLPAVFTIGVGAVLFGMIGIASVVISHSAVAAIAAMSLAAFGFFIMGIMVRVAEEYR